MELPTARLTSRPEVAKRKAIVAPNVVTAWQQAVRDVDSIHSNRWADVARATRVDGGQFDKLTPESVRVEIEPPGSCG